MECNHLYRLTSLDSRWNSHFGPNPLFASIVGRTLWSSLEQFSRFPPTEADFFPQQTDYHCWRIFAPTTKYRSAPNWVDFWLVSFPYWHCGRSHGRSQKNRDRALEGKVTKVNGAFFRDVRRIFRKLPRSSRRFIFLTVYVIRCSYFSSPKGEGIVILILEGDWRSSWPPAAQTKFQTFQNETTWKLSQFNYPARGVPGKLKPD